MPPIDPFLTDGTTFVNPFGLLFTLTMGLLLIALPRKYALLPVIILICYMTMGMRIMVGGLNFTMIRILLVFGWIRLLIRGEFRSIKLNQLDKIMLWFTLSSIITYTLLWGDYDALKDRLGMAYNTLGFYFFFRFLLRDMDDIVRTFKMTALAIVPLAAAMVLEKLTGRNSFAAFGGVSPMTVIRDGVLRCQGPFAHPILAGTFGATLVPYFIVLWWQRRVGKLIAIIGIVSCTLITFTSGSSGPVLAELCGIFGMAMWFMRKRMRQIRWGLAIGLLVLHMVMKAPVWFILARVDLFSGSTGFHRAELIDRAIANFWDWWLIGTKSTAAWADADQHLFDVTSQYIRYAADGGLITMVLFIMIIVRGFRGVGRYVKAEEGVPLQASLISVWALGAAMLAHTVTYLSVSYFDQNIVNWYLLLAMISTVAGPYLLTNRRVDLPGAYLHRDDTLPRSVASSAHSALTTSISRRRDLARTAQ
jgi:hypothetical protein